MQCNSVPVIPSMTSTIAGIMAQLYSIIDLYASIHSSNNAIYNNSINMKGRNEVCSDYSYVYTALCTRAPVSIGVVVPKNIVYTMYSIRYNGMSIKEYFHVKVRSLLRS